MWLQNLLQLLTSTSTPRPLIRRRPLDWRTRFQGFAALEDRWLPSAYSIVQIPIAPQDVNNNGQVVGQHAAGQAGLWYDGTLINLGSLAGPSGWSTAYAI